MTHETPETVTLRRATAARARIIDSISRIALPPCPHGQRMLDYYASLMRELGRIEAKRGIAA